MTDYSHDQPAYTFYRFGRRYRTAEKIGGIIGGVVGTLGLAALSYFGMRLVAKDHPWVTTIVGTSALAGAGLGSKYGPRIGGEVGWRISQRRTELSDKIN